MNNALVYGATGLIGLELTNQLLNHPGYGKVRILLRKKIDLEHKKLEQFVYDFEQPEPDLVQGDHIFCALGTTIKNAGSKARFRQIDHDFVIETAKYAHQNGATLFSLVSAIGADENSRFFYNKVKGMLEKELSTIAFESLHIARPSLLLGKRNEYRFLESISQKLMPLFSGLTPKRMRAIRGVDVAKAMILYANSSKPGKHIISNEQLLDLSAE